MAAAIGRSLGFHVEEFPADWKKEGRAAGFKRNILMLELGPDIVIAFWDWRSSGTRHTIDEAKKRGIPTEIVSPIRGTRQIQLFRQDDA